jgi:hypothetical protein
MPGATPVGAADLAHRDGGSLPRPPGAT